jgi:hypothetical protein
LHQLAQWFAASDRRSLNVRRHLVFELDSGTLTKTPACDIESVDFLHLRGGNNLNASIKDAAMATYASPQGAFKFPVAHWESAAAPMSRCLDTVNNGKTTLSMPHQGHWVGIFLGKTGAVIDISIYNSLHSSSHPRSVTAADAITNALLGSN